MMSVWNLLTSLFRLKAWEAYSYFIHLTTTSVINSYNFSFSKGKRYHSVQCIVWKKIYIPKNIYSEKVTCVFAVGFFWWTLTTLSHCVTWIKYSPLGPCSFEQSFFSWPSLPHQFLFERLNPYVVLFPCNLFSNSMILVIKIF